MKKWNQFSGRFEKKTTEELKSILDNPETLNDAILAACWELQKRGDSSTEIDRKEAYLVEKYKAFSQKRKQQLRYKTFGPRFAAAIIDGILLGTFVIPTLSSLAVSRGFTDPIHTSLIEFAPFIYSVLLHAKYGQTLGKSIMSIKVVDNTSETNISFKQALLRDLVPILILLIFIIFNIIQPQEDGDIYILFTPMESIFELVLYIPFFWWVIEIVSMLTNSKSRAVHDFMARTVVVRPK